MHRVSGLEVPPARQPQVGLGMEVMEIERLYLLRGPTTGIGRTGEGGTTTSGEILTGVRGETSGETEGTTIGIGIAIGTGIAAMVIGEEQDGIGAGRRRGIGTISGIDGDEAWS